MLAGRFTSSGAGNAPLLDEPKKPEPGLYQPPPKSTVPPPSSSSDPVPNVVDLDKLSPAQNAARLGMFGHLTRTTELWRPAKLACKRFGVRVPYGEEGAEEADLNPGGAWGEAGSSRGGYGGGGGKTGEVLGKKSMETLMMSTGFRRLQPEAETHLSTSSTSAAPPPQTFDGASKSTIATKAVSDGPSLATVGLGDDEAQGSETLTYVKAPRDIFAAIFADSDDEEEDDDDEEEGTLPGTDDNPMAASKPIPAAPPKTLSTATATATAPPPPPPSIPTPDPVESTLSSETIGSYRPSFVSTSTRPSTTNGESSKQPKLKKRKREKASSLSFDVDDGEEDGGSFKVEVKKKKKEKEKKVDKAEKVARVEEEQEWVEVPSVAQFPPKLEQGPTLAPGGGSKRARAADLFD